MIGASGDRKPLPIGESDFDRVIENGMFYIDKTLFIRDIIDRSRQAYLVDQAVFIRDFIDIGATVTLCTRPGRFGKTLNLTMLKCFFEDTVRIGGKDTRGLFRGLNIESAGERYMECHGKHPVIFLSFKDVEADSFDGAFGLLKERIAEEFERHAYAAEKISCDYDRNLFKKLSDRTGSLGDYSKSLRFLCKCLEDCHGRKVVVLIDEYDVPLRVSSACGYYKEAVDFICSLFGIAFKNNPHLEFSVITGCLRFAKESLFAGLRHFDAASVLGNDYSEYFGFTQGEMDAMLQYYGFSDKRQVVIDCYNGYLFGNTEVYNPWSGIHAVNSWNKDINEPPRLYWVNVDGDNIIREVICKIGSNAKTDLKTLMAGGSVSVVFREGVTYNEMYDDADSLWNVLLLIGYLRKVRESVDHIGRTVMDVKIPNGELYTVFEDEVRDRLKL
jgi:hypothetical protein